MKYFKLLLLCCILLSGCSGEAEITLGGVDLEVDNVEKPSAVIDITEAITNELETEISDVVKVNMPNPYKGRTEASDPWQYDLFEIAKGSQYLSFDDKLEYKRDYSTITTHEAEDFNGLLHKYSCTITLPQATGDEPWMNRINYYQQLMPDLIAEGDSIWEENINNTDIRAMYYYYEGAFKFGNIINVMRSKHSFGMRPTRGHTPFTDLFSVIDGAKVSLDDLFCVDRSVYLPVLYLSLSQATLQFKDNYNPVCDEEYVNFSQTATYLDESSVAVTSFGLVFIYPAGSIGSEVGGALFINVPYEDLSGMLNPIYFPE